MVGEEKKALWETNRRWSQDRLSRQGWEACMETKSNNSSRSITHASGATRPGPGYGWLGFINRMVAIHVGWQRAPAIRVRRAKYGRGGKVTGKVTAIRTMKPHLLERMGR